MATTSLGTKNYLGDGYDQFLSNEKRALLALTAEHGTNAQAEFDKQRQSAEAARRQSLEAAAARGQAIHAPEALQAELSQNYDKMLGAFTDPAVSSTLIHGREMDRIAAANAAYIEAMRAQAPLLKSQLDAQAEAMRAAAARGRGGGGGSGGGGGGGEFPGLLGEGEKWEKEDPNKLANELADLALRLPQRGIADRQGARQMALDELDLAIEQGAVTPAEGQMIRRKLLMSFASVDAGTATYSSAQLGRNTSFTQGGWRGANLAGRMPQNVRGTGHGSRGAALRLASQPNPRTRTPQNYRPKSNQPLPYGGRPAVTKKGTNPPKKSTRATK